MGPWRGGTSNSFSTAESAEREESKAGREGEKKRKVEKGANVPTIRGSK